MKVKELYEIAKYSEIELHSGFDGEMVASSPEDVEKFANAKVLSIIPRIKVVTKYSYDYAKAYLYIFIDNNDIERIKSETQSNKI